MLRWQFPKALMAAALAVLCRPALAGLVVNENSAFPGFPSLQLVSAAVDDAERDVRFNRNPAQTFRLDAPLKLDKFYIEYEEGIAGKEFQVRLFSVANTTAGDPLIDPNNGGFSGTVYFSGLTHVTTGAINTANGTTAVMEFDLTGADEVVLPASVGNSGYAIQFLRTGTGAGTDDTAERAFKWRFENDGNNYFDGRTYAINGGGVDANDDYLLSFVGTPAPVAIAGVNPVNIGEPELPIVVANSGLQNDVRSHSDRTHTFANVPIELLGAEYIRLPNDARDNATFQLDVQLGVTSDVYLLIDDRVGDDNSANGPTIGGGLMDWVLAQGYADTGLNVDIDENDDGSVNQFFSVFARMNVPAGTISFFEQNNGGSRNMYSIAVIGQVQAVPEPATSALLLLGGAALLRRSRRAA